MARILIPLFLFHNLYFVVASSAAADIVEDHDTISSEESVHSFILPKGENDNNNIEISLQKMENIAVLAEKSRREGILPTEHTDELHSRMVQALEDITDQLTHKSITYKFLNSNGVDRIITPTIGINHELLKKQLLILIKTLFNVAPITTTALIPISIVDKLLNIFENDDNLALKTHALDILSIWLPNNPEVQARVMNLKGLEPFYNQISKLDINVVHIIVDLFNKIIEEHLKVRSNKSRNKEDFERIQLYKRIGLIERLSTPQICRGLLDVLQTLMTFSNDKTQLPTSTFGLVRNMHLFCLKTYKGNDKAIHLIEDLYKFVTDWHNTKLLINMGLNPTEVRSIVENLFDKLVDYKERDEF